MLQEQIEQKIIYLKTVNTELNNLEPYTRRNSIMIYGINEPPLLLLLTGVAL